MREVPLEEWDSALDRIDVTDAYFRRDYVRACAVLEQGDPVLLVDDESGMAHVFIRRAIPGSDRTDLVAPYGYAGPAGRDIPADANARLSTFLERSGEVTVFFRSHPAYLNAQDWPGATHVVQLQPTIAWRTDADRDLESGLHQRHRRIHHGPRGRRDARQGVQHHR